jgi:molybdopterin adenylyltransferase
VNRPFRAAVLTVSDTAAAGGRQDTSGDEAARFIEANGGVVAIREAVPDERELIAERLRHFADDLKVALVLTTGGTGFAGRDVTPEATRDVVEKLAPGLAEAMRRETLPLTPLAVLSRGVSGIRGGTLIVNLPGSPPAVRECAAVLLPVLHHALDIIAGVIRRHDPPGESA